MADKEMKDLARRLEAAVASAYFDAKSFTEEELASQRAESTRYYNGEPFGDEEEGRSQVVSRDVHDTVQSFMPSVMRVLFGGERPVEFVPTGPEDIALASQITDYINDVVIRQDNDGFTEVHSAVKDALVRKVGIWKWWWDKSTRLEAVHSSGLTEEQVMLLSQDDSVEKVEVELVSEEGIEPKRYDVIAYRRINRGRARFAAVPADEFLVDRRARSIRTASFVAHRSQVRVTDLVAMGYDRDEVLEQGTLATTELDTEEALARNPYENTLGAADGSDNPDLRRVLYVEAWMPFLLGGEDDPAQIVKVCGVAGGKAFKILHHEPVDEIPFAIFCPDPEPHTIWGLCPADDVKDIQRIKSAVLRGTLDSLSLSIHPRYEAVDEQVNLQDLMNSEIGGIVRVKQPGMLREISLPFVGDKTLPMLDYLDRVKESRTKQSQASQGLDADALQSSTKAAVSATISAAQAQIELVTRVIAETGYKALFLGLYRLVIRNQDEARTVRLRGRWVDVDPRVWDAEMDVTVNVALGAGSNEEKIATLMGIAAKQEAVLMAAPGNPMVSFHEYRNTLAKMAELAGWKDATTFFKEVPEGYQPPAPPSPDGGDAQALAQAQMMEIQVKAQVEQAKLAFEQEKLREQMALERYKAELDARVKLTIAAQDNEAKLTEAQIDAAIEKMKAQQESATRITEARVAGQANVDREKAKPKKEAKDAG